MKINGADFRHRLANGRDSSAAQVKSMTAQQFIRSNASRRLSEGQIERERVRENSAQCIRKSQHHSKHKQYNTNVIIANDKRLKTSERTTKSRKNSSLYHGSSMQNGV